MMAKLKAIQHLKVKGRRFKFSESKNNGERKKKKKKTLSNILNRQREIRH